MNAVTPQRENSMACVSFPTCPLAMAEAERFLPSFIDKVEGVMSKHGVSDATCYKWKSQYSGMTVPHLAKLRELQEENARLKRMYADLALMHSALKDVVERKL